VVLRDGRVGGRGRRPGGEILRRLGGSGIVTLNDERVPIQKGATIFIPKVSQHGFEKPSTELFIRWAERVNDFETAFCLV